MAIVYIAKPTRRSFKVTSDVCPDGYECVADQWTFDAARSDMVHPDFRFEGFKGNWEPFKDAGKEGWHVYWKGDAGLYHPITLDMVPTDGDKDCRSAGCPL